MARQPNAHAMRQPESDRGIPHLPGPGYARFLSPSCTITACSTRWSSEGGRRPAKPTSRVLATVVSRSAMALAGFPFDVTGASLG